MGFISHFGRFRQFGNKRIPTFTRIGGIEEATEAIWYDSDQYMTNLKFSLTFPFNGRQKTHVAKWCDENNLIDKDDKRAVWFAINGCKCQTPINDKARPLGQNQRSRLGILDANTKVTTEWRRNHPEQVLRYYGHILGDGAVG